MLQISQAKQLVKEGLHVRYEGGRVVWMEEGLAFLDGRERLMHAESADVIGEDWQEVLKDEQAKLSLRTVNIHYGGHFHVIQCDGTPVCTKVVKFANPELGKQPTLRAFPHYVVIYSLELMTDEDACEMAMDAVLKYKGFKEDNAKPELVI